MFTLENLFKLGKFIPNKEQIDAIKYINGPLYITAGPGSGKTSVLLWRTLNLIVFQNTKPEEIFLSTFTEKAAHQLKEGLRSKLGLVTNLNGVQYDLSSMYIGTVHSLCNRMLLERRRFVVNHQRNHAPTLLDQLGQYFHTAQNTIWDEIIARAGLGEDGNDEINEIFGFSSSSKYAAISNCISVFNRFSEECIDPKTALEKIKTKRTATYLDKHELTTHQMKILIQAYGAYLELLQRERNTHLTDFSLLQQEAFNLLEDSKNSGKIFTHVIVDEYQDTNTIQERIFFKLASGSSNLCIVGDDDQALYRFRGATVENFVEFPERCQKYLGRAPYRVTLSTNYRSRTRIVDFFSTFINGIDWSKPGKGNYYRVADKNIIAFRKDKHPSVVASTAGKPEDVCLEIATLVRRIIDEKKVENPNQIAFLFPSLKNRGDTNTYVVRMKSALEKVGLEIYAPRAARFLEVDESYEIFGLLMKIFGRPQSMAGHSHDVASFHDWMDEAEARAEKLISKDDLLNNFIFDRQKEIKRIIDDYTILIGVVKRHRWDINEPYQLSAMKRILYNAPGLSENCKKLVASSYLDRLVEERVALGKPFLLHNILRRVTSLDWNVLDLFYRLCGFQHFKRMFDLAEQGKDEGPISNLGLITQYLSRFIDDNISIITADFLADETFQRIFFYSFLFALYRLGETELEDADDPFPKGRIPFLTIHQAKGLEFPIVVLGNPRKDTHRANQVEIITRPLLDREPSEPLDRMPEFDAMRMFYVALSRAKNLLIIPHYKGPGQHLNHPFDVLLDDHFPRIPNLNLDTLPAAKLEKDILGKTYSFTSDFLMYKKCPREYMIFRKYGFVPSRSQTMFFGNLVHRTLEELHHEIIRRRQNT
jgi:DNA helicase-2/ATP-dependent DNA helicase PcrA